MKLFAIALLTALTCELAFSTHMGAQSQQAEPIGYRILADKALFPKNPERPEPLAMLVTVMIGTSDGREKGWAHIGIAEDYAPRIEAVVTKYGKPDKIVKESRDSQDPREPEAFVHYWGEYGLAVAEANSTGKVKWICRRVAKK